MTKLAVLADIHANLYALEAVAAHVENWRPDHVIVAGDILNRGARPRECLEFVQARERSCGWRTVRGNHEDYVIGLARLGPDVSPAMRAVHRGSYWTLAQLGGQVAALEAMPFQQSLIDPHGGEARVVHASMRGNRDGIFPHTCVEGLAAQISPPPAVLCAGHTHLPLVRRLDGTLVVNAGSVGLPFDGDRRAAYAQLTWRAGAWRADVIRLDYPVERTEQDFTASGYLEGAGPLAEIVRCELQNARSLLFGWADRYQARALQGEVTMEDSVREYLRETGLAG